MTSCLPYNSFEQTRGNEPVEGEACALPELQIKEWLRTAARWHSISHSSLSLPFFSFSLSWLTALPVLHHGPLWTCSASRVWAEHRHAWESVTTWRCLHVSGRGKWVRDWPRTWCAARKCKHARYITQIPPYNLNHGLHPSVCTACSREHLLSKRH